MQEHDLKPSDIASVKILTTAREARHTTSLPKKYPRNAESADHSAYWANAIAIKEQRFGPDLFEPENYTDPVVLDLIEKIAVEVDPDPPFGSMFHGKSEITTIDGRFFRKCIEQPHGFGNDPLTDTELEEKFRQMAIKYMPIKQINMIFDTIWNVDKLDDMGKLTELLVFPT